MVQHNWEVLQSLLFPFHNWEATCKQAAFCFQPYFLTQPKTAPTALPNIQQHRQSRDSTLSYASILFNLLMQMWSFPSLLPDDLILERTNISCSRKAGEKNRLNPSRRDVWKASEASRPDLSLSIWLRKNINEILWIDLTIKKCEIATDSTWTGIQN